MNTPRKDHAESQPDNNLSVDELATAVRGFLISDFPDVDVQVELDPDKPPFIRVLSATFADHPLPQLRSDIVKQVPDDFRDEHLADAHWYVSTPEAEATGIFLDDLQMLEAVNAIEAYEAEEFARATKTPGVEQPDQNRR
jgi:hypothetical protein